MIADLDGEYSDRASLGSRSSGGEFSGSDVTDDGGGVVLGARDIARARGGMAEARHEPLGVRRFG